MNKIFAVALIVVALISLGLAVAYYYVLKQNSDISLSQVLQGTVLKTVEWSQIPEYIESNCKEISQFENEGLRDEYLSNITKSNNYVDVGKSTNLNKFINYDQVGKNGRGISSDVGPGCWFILMGDANRSYAVAFETDKGVIEIVKVKNFPQAIIPKAN